MLEDPYQEQHDEDPLAPARGIINALGISSVLLVSILVVIWAVW